MPVDPLPVVLGLVKQIWICVRKVKVLKRRCKNLAWRCELLIDALRENIAEIVPPNADALHNAETILLSVRRKVEEWANLNTMDSILAQGAISEGVDDLHHQIDTCIAAHQVRIGQELLNSHRVQALVAERDRIELRETIQDLLKAFSQYTLENRTRTHYSPPRGGGTTTYVLYGIAKEIIDSQPSTSDHNGFDNAVKRIYHFLATLEFSDVPAGDPMSDSSSASQISAEARGQPGSSIFHPPGSRGSRRHSSPLNSEDEVTAYSPRTMKYTSPLPAVHSDPSRMLSGHNNLPTGSHSDAASRRIHQETTQASTASIFDASGTSSALGIALSTPERTCLPSGIPGVIKRATLEGLIQYLLTNPEDVEQLNTFFIGQPAFIQPQDVLKILIRRFNEASADDVRDNIRTNVICLIKNWLTNQHIIIANDVLAEMHEFVYTRAAGSSGALGHLALEVLIGIPDKASLNFTFSPIMSSPPSQQDSNPTASQLAVALATLERERYLCILAAEYIAHAHARNLTSYSLNLQEAIALNKRITNWVIWSILQFDNHEGRSNTSRFFVNTAKECRKIRNFSSMCAIVGALQSDAISCLMETMLRKERKEYQKLTALLDQGSDYSAYKAAIQRDERRGCIPWHDVHLHDISVVLRQEEDVEECDKLPLINFEKWTHLKEKALDALRYRDIPPDYEEDGLETAMAYLKRQLQAVSVDDDISRRLQTKSDLLKKNEETMQRDKAARKVGIGSRH